MLNVRLAGDHQYGEIAIHLAVTGDVIDGVFFVLLFSHEMSWMRSGTELSQFLRGFPTYFFMTCKLRLPLKALYQR